MNYKVLNDNWNADPNGPMPELKVTGNNITVEFWLNYHMYHQFKDDDKGRLTFYNCYKYDFGGSNDEGYYRGQHRYNYNQLPWGEFYLLDTDWETDFAKETTILSPPVNQDNLNHYLFFFRDECFECVAESYKLEFIKGEWPDIQKTL